MSPVAPPGLIFVEGMPGAGKTTTARAVAQWFAERGASARCFLEMDDDNPIRTRGVDAMRANHPLIGRLPDVDAQGFARDPGVYAVEQWGRLARRAAQGDDVLVLESRYVQNSVQPRYIVGAPEAKVVDGFGKITAQLAEAGAEPLLIYLRPSDVRAHLQRTLEARPEEWSRWFVASFESGGWAQGRGLAGFEALASFYEAWEALAERLVAMHPGPALIVDDPQRDWQAAHARIRVALGL